jgi:MFS superfamily sulfate permease-like transporter
MVTRLYNRLGSMRWGLAELSGSLGDLGTFIPLAVSLMVVCGLDVGTVLVFAGLFNVITGWVFNQPVPVQPMKAIAAVAIAEGLAPGEIAAAGFGAGVVLLALAFTGLVTAAEKWVPRPVVRGIQLGVGLKLATTGVEMILGVEWWGADSRLVALVGAVMVLATTRMRRFPSALILLMAGLVLLVVEQPEVFAGTPLGWAGPSWIWPTLEQWRVGFLRGTVPQVPLTLLNSVIAVCALSEDLFRGRGIGTRPVAISVGLMNVGACLFGAMPACHGSGGLAGQYRFGARSGGSVVILGLAKIVVGVLFGAAAIPVLLAFPASLLGLLLVFAGLELALPARDCVDRDAFFIAAATAGGILAANTLVGFILGLVAALILTRIGRDGPAEKRALPPGSKP